MFTFLTSKAGKFKICQIYQEQNPHGGNFHFCLLFLSELFQCHFNCTVPNEINFPRYSMKCSGKKRDTVLHGIFYVVSFFPRRMSYRGKKIGLLFGQCTATAPAAILAWSTTLF